MPTLSGMNVPKPKSWDEFEEITLSSLKIKWRSPNLQRNGRQGQKQDGVDICGEDDLNCFIGVQCKLTEKNISLNSIKKEIEKAERFQPELSSFYIATTSSCDSDIQKQIRILSQERIQENKFPIGIMF